MKILACLHVTFLLLGCNGGSSGGSSIVPTPPGNGGSGDNSTLPAPPGNGGSQDNTTIPPPPVNGGGLFTATSCVLGDVRSAIAASSDGDTVIIPAGSCTWTQELEINKNITLQGAGIDNTTIIGANAGGTLLFAPSGSGNARLTGVTFNATVNTGYHAQIYLVQPSGSSDWLRMDHVKIRNDGGGSLMLDITAHSGILIDHCEFQNIKSDVPELVHISLGEHWDNSSWGRASSVGTANNVFIEDSTFTNSYTLDGSAYALQSYQGATFVFRYNTVQNLSIDSHGATIGATHGTKSYEIYNNTFTHDLSFSGDYMKLRGGTGVVFNNTWNRRGGIILMDYGIAGIPPNGCCCIGPGEYAIDQIGMGKITGIVPSSGSGQCTAPRAWRQDLEPAYFWNNKENLTTFSPGVDGSSGCSSCPGGMQSETTYIKNGLTFYDDTTAPSGKPGYVTYIYPHPLVLTH